MSGSLRDPRVPSFDNEGEMRRLLAAEQGAPPPSTDAQVRMARRMTASLAETAPAWAVGGKLLAISTMLVVAAGLAYWGWVMRRPAPVVVIVEPRVAAPVVAVEPVSTTDDGEKASTPNAEFPLVRVRRADTLAAEQRLVEAARDALSHGDPRLAYQSLDTHAHRFPRGQLREERESLSIRALLTQGRSEQALKRAEAFLAHDGESLFAPVVRSLLVKARATAPVNAEHGLP